MQQINVGVFYGLGKNLQACWDSARAPIKYWTWHAGEAKRALEALLRGDPKFQLDESAGPAGAMRAVLEAALAMHEADGEAVLTDEQVSGFNASVGVFDQALILELGRAPIFYVTPKGVYDTRRLINNADAAYEGYADRLPREALEDTREAGRCLAFSLYTAAGFHIARATEAVIKRYMEAYGCPPIRDSQRNWGKYLEALTKRDANKTIVHHIDQLRELHRNPITHPEVTLKVTDATALQAMCHSLIQAMVADMETKRPAPNPEIVAMLPPPEVEGEVVAASGNGGSAQ